MASSLSYECYLSLYGGGTIVNASRDCSRDMCLEMILVNPNSDYRDFDGVLPPGFTKDQITSGFGLRKDPFTGEEKYHSGVDLRAPRGTPVYPVGGGRVIKIDTKGRTGSGKFVNIQHSNGYITRYLHLSNVGVKLGREVDFGTQVGSVGSTGWSTGPHLHFEVLDPQGRAQNPLNYRWRF